MTVVVNLCYTNKDWLIDWQRAGPFLCKCGDEYASLETNGTRTSSYLSLLYPCCDLSPLLWLAHMALFEHGPTCDHCAPCLVNKSQWESTRSHKDTDCISVHIHFSQGGNCWHSDSRPGIWQICDPCAPTISKPATDYWLFAHTDEFFTDVSCV